MDPDPDQPDLTFHFDAGPDSIFQLAPHQNDANLRPWVIRPSTASCASIESVQGPLELHFEPPQLLNFDFDANPDPDPAFDVDRQSNPIPNPSFHSDADPDSQRC